MIFEKNIHRYVYKYLEKIIYKYIFTSANLKCTSSNMKMYPSLGTSTIGTQDRVL